MRTLRRMRADFTLHRRLYLWFQELAGRSTEVFAPHGIEIRIPKEADTDIRYLLMRGKPYEREEAGMVRSFLPEGGDVIELGGCMGAVSALIRARIGPEARHVIVEANPDLARICEANAGARGGRTEVVVAAVDYSGAREVTFASGRNAHVGHVARQGEGGFTVPVTTLSELARRLPGDRFSLVCDIEGAETALFEAETGLLPRLSCVILETHVTTYPGGAADLAAMKARIAAAGLAEVAVDGDVCCFLRRP